ncbi:cytidine deaminase [Mucidula mucida]|nr:cytidine deaminase [Mucidula mucida]
MPMICLSDEQQAALIIGAFEGKENAYCPYSKFPVDAALLTADGRIKAKRFVQKG